MGYYLEVEYGMRKDVPVDVDKARKGGGGMRRCDYQLLISFLILLFIQAAVVSTLQSLLASVGVACSNSDVWDRSP